jgi:hypothetical protein
MIVAAPASDSTEAVLSRKRLAAAILARDEARRRERSRGSSATCWPGWRQSLYQPETSIGTRVTTALAT